METQRRQNSRNMEGEQTFITRRQISDPDENTTRESPEVFCFLFVFTTFALAFAFILRCK